MAPRSPSVGFLNSKTMKRTILLLAAAGTFLSGAAQSITQKYERFLTDPYKYVAYRTDGDIKIDGVLDEPAWQKALLTESFADISGEGFPTPAHNTQARLLWDDKYLYVGAMLDEPNVWATLTQHDAVIYQDPDFEIFIDPDDDAQNYFEIEMNAIGTLFELFIQKPYRSPGRAFVTFAWDAPGLKADAHIYGTLNKAGDTDKGWSVEFAIPREALAAEFDNCLKAGNYLRVGFSRVEWQTTTDANGKSERKKDAAGKLLPEDNWTWPSTGQIAMHMPERWSYVYLSDKTVGQGTDTFDYPADRPAQKLLWAMFYAQADQKAKTGSYYSQIKDFKLTAAEKSLLPQGAKLKIETTTNKYEITVQKADGSSISIDENGYLCRRTK